MVYSAEHMYEHVYMNIFCSTNMKFTTIYLFVAYLLWEVN